MNSSDGLPVIDPPWSTLTAYNLNKGTIEWQIPVGGVSKLEAQGIKNIGSIGPRGGVAVTAAGLIFSGTNSDSTIRAYDKDTGKVLWEQKLPSAPEGIPAVYAVGGREYVVMSAVASKAASANPDEEAPVRQATATSAPENNPGIQGYYVFCRVAKLT